MMRMLFIVIGPADHVAVVPLACADLDAKRQAVVIEAGGETDRWNAQHVHPGGIAMRSSADLAILRHGFVDRRHLGGRIYEAVEVQAVHLGVVHGLHFSLGSKKRGFRLWIGFEVGLLKVRRFRHSRVRAADNNVWQGLTHRTLVLRRGMVSGWTESREEFVCTFA